MFRVVHQDGDFESVGGIWSNRWPAFMIHGPCAHVVCGFGAIWRTRQMGYRDNEVLTKWKFL